MATYDQLLSLLEKGEIGKLLAKKFSGERGRAYPNEDLDVLVVFPSEEQTPSAESIQRLLREHFTSLGYVFEDVPNARRDSVQAYVYLPGRKRDGMVSICITTNYPFDEKRASLRLNTLAF